ncbi:MAG: toprim domain-containing protein [Methylovulum sp.]|nr:toprim domain-containing protein [Methylovulum sp.]
MAVQNLSNTTHDSTEDFKNAMRDFGITPPDYIIGDGNLHRFHIEGDKGGSINGWYKLHLDGRAAGSFGSWKHDINQRWKAGGEFRRLTQAEKHAFAIEKQRQGDENQKAAAVHYEQAKRKASYIWCKSTPAINHPYLTKKRIQPSMTRLYKGVLVIPMKDEHHLVSLQFIADDGSKTMMGGGIAKSAFYTFGDIATDNNTVLICEGFATGASLYENRGLFTFVAFSAGNLINVAKVVKKHYPDSEIIICGDNDFSGVGQKAARAAALAVGGKYILPPDVGTDFNDVLSGGSHV